VVPDAVAVAVVPDVDLRHHCCRVPRSLTDAVTLVKSRRGECRRDQRYRSMLLAYAAEFLFAILVVAVSALFQLALP